MPYEAKKQKCKKEDGSSGTHAIYKKGTNEKVGCTNDPSGYMGKLYSVEETTNEDQQMTVSRQRLKEIIQEELQTVLNEEDKPLQKLEKGIEKRGTEGTFSKWCGGEVTQACIDRAAKEGGHRAKQASLAVTFSKAKGGGPSLTYPKKKLKET